MENNKPMRIAVRSPTSLPINKKSPPAFAVGFVAIPELKY